MPAAVEVSVAPTCHSRPSGPHTRRTHNTVSCPFYLIVSWTKLFPLLTWAFQTTVLMSCALLPQVQVIPTGISPYKQRWWVHPLSSKSSSELNEYLATKTMTEDVGILRHNMYSFPYQSVCAYTNKLPAFLSFATLPPLRGEGTAVSLSWEGWA